MPIYENETTTLDNLKDKAKHLKCECGGNLLVAWGGSTGHNCYMVRCSKDAEHSNFVRPAQISNYDLPGYNMPGTINAKEKELKRSYGEMTTNALIKQSGGNVLTVLDEVKATAIIKTIWPGAPDVEVKKAAMICEQYGLNPLMKHLYLIPFNTKVKATPKVPEHWETSFSVVLGIKASRIIARRKGEYAYLDDTPRYMTQNEGVKILGDEYEPDKYTYAITRLADRKGNTSTGTGKWPKDTSPKGIEKGNSKLNMAMIRSERQALERLFPDSLPSEAADVVDERYQDLPQVTVSEVKPELEQLPEPQEKNQIDENQDEPEQVQTIEAKQQVSEPTQSQSSAQPQKTKRDPATIKNLGDFYTACLTDLAEHVASKDDVLKALGKSEKDITDPAAEYQNLCKKWGK